MLTNSEHQAASNQNPVILYDGLCGLCNGSIEWVRRLDWRHKFAVRDLNQREEIARDYPGLDAIRALQEMHVIMPDGRQLVGFFAFREIA